MMDLRPYRAREARLADWLPWAGLIAPGIVLNKNGAFQRTLTFRGPDLDSSTLAELVGASHRLDNGAINQSGAMLGLKAGGSGMTLAELHDPARVAVEGKDLYGRVTEMGDGMNIITDFLTLATIFFAAVVILIAFFVLALQIFVQLIAFKLGSLAAFVALPWGVFSGTAWAAERPLGWVATSAVRLFLLAFVASVAISFVGQLPQTMTLENGGVLDVLLFGITILALSFLAPTLASEVMQGSPSLSAAQPMQAGAAGAGIVIGGALAVKNAITNRNSSRTRAGARGAHRSNSARPKPNYAAMKPPVQKKP